MRSMSMPNCPRRAKFNHKALLAAFNAHVRSVVEYASVTWSGAAKTHLVRFERLQHRFLMWLASSSQGRCESLDYDYLLAYFKTTSIKARFTQTDIFFMRNVFHRKIDSDHLTSLFGLTVPGRRSRHTGLFNVPFGRVNTVKSSFLTRLPLTCNRFLQEEPTADLFHQSRTFRSDVYRFARGQGTYLN